MADTSRLLLISELEEDVAFGKAVAASNGYEFEQLTTSDSIRRHLLTHSGTVVFWNAENAASFGGMVDVLPKYAKHPRIFAITGRRLDAYPHLLKYPIFGHHLRRRFEPPALSFYSRLCQVALSGHPFGIHHYFAKDTAIKKIRLTRSSHKSAAVEAIQNSLGKLGIPERLAAIVAQSADELIMNAIFDAPVGPGGKTTRHDQPRDSDFEFAESEVIDIEFALNDEYMGILVADRFGSLKKKFVYDSIRDYLKNDTHALEKTAGSRAGFGLHGILHAGLNLILNTKQGNRTEACLFFPKTDDYKSFKNSFRFFSLLAQ